MPAKASKGPGPSRQRSRAPGRPRSQRAHRAVLKAARELIERGGYPAATIEAIAERSGVAKTTIYRWWPNRASLVVDLLVEISWEAVPIPAGPDPLRALRNEFRGIASVSESLPGRLLVSLLGVAQSDPEVRSALLRGIFRPRTDATAGVISRAQEAGLIRKDISPHTAVDLFVGPIFYRMIVRHAPPTESFALEAFQVLIDGLGPVSVRRKRPARKRK
jgi:AcrR family transcriptional regulator